VQLILWIKQRWRQLVSFGRQIKAIWKSQERYKVASPIYVLIIIIVPLALYLIGSENLTDPISHVEVPDDSKLVADSLRFIVASDFHFDNGRACSKNARNGDYLKSFLAVLDSTYADSVDFVVINGDLVEYQDRFNHFIPDWRTCLDAAAAMIRNSLSRALLDRTLFVIGNNEVYLRHTPLGMQVDRQSLDQFAYRFLPTLTTRNRPQQPAYWWQDPLPRLKARGIRMFGLFVPDDWIVDQRIYGSADNLQAVMLDQLDEFETWVDGIVTAKEGCLALVFVHHGPVTCRTDGLPVGYRGMYGKDVSKTMRSAAKEASFFYDNVMKRIAGALEKLDKNSNSQSAAHAAVFAGHYHVGRVVKQLEGVDVIIEGALVKNRNVAGDPLHTFVDVKYAPKPGSPRLDALYDGGMLVTFNKLDPDDQAQPVQETLHTVLWLRK
jgi:hypothetical protein